MALTTIKTGGLADNSVTDAKVADAITVTGAQTGITQVGTLTAGTWNGTAIASAYLDADTAHLSGSTFTGDVYISASGSPSFRVTDTTNTVTGKFQADDTVGKVGTHTNHSFQLFSNNTTALTIDTSQNATFAGNVTINSPSGDTGWGFTLTNSYSASSDVQISMGYANSSNRNSGIGVSMDDTNSGEYLLNLASGGTDRFRVRGDGNVGIGYNNPDARLVVGSGTSGQNERINIYAGTNAWSSIYFTDAGNGSTQYQGVVQYNHSDNHMDFYTNQAEAMRITSAGNVGISEASPDAKLHVTGQNSYTTANIGEVSGLGFVRFQPNGNSEDSLWIHNGGNVLGLQASTNANSSTAENITLNAYGGNVGIGDDSPSYRLDVKNNIDSWVQRITNTHANAYGLWIDHNASTSDNNDRKFFMCEDASEVKCIIWSDGDVNNDDGAYGTISDVRIKQGIRDANSQWDDIKAMKIRNFKKNHDVIKYGDKAWEQIGVVAQELEEAGMDKLVREHTALESEVSNNEDINKGDMVKSVQSSIIYMKAVKCLQEAMAKIETLEAKVTALENA